MGCKKKKRVESKNNLNQTQNMLPQNALWGFVNVTVITHFFFS